MCEVVEENGSVGISSLREEAFPDAGRLGCEPAGESTTARTSEDFIADMAARFVEVSEAPIEEAKVYAGQVFNGIDDAELIELERGGWTTEAAEEWADTDMSYWRDAG